MIALVLYHAGFDPTAVIGGRLSAFGSNARLGRGQYMVAEADESDRSFLKLSPAIAVVTNIDHEHLENYRDFDDLQQAFVDFANKVPFYGAVVACLDDAPLAEVLPGLHRRVITYGIRSPGAEFTGEEVPAGPFQSACRVTWHKPGSSPAALGEIRLNVPGRHNLQNALAAVAVGIEIGAPFDQIARSLASFNGVERRFERKGEAAGVVVVDDYGHHPTEIAAVVEAARSGPGRRVVVVFQPHRYTRTQRLFSRFGPALANADEIVLTDIYAAGEEAIPGVTVEALAEAVRAATTAPVHLVKDLERLPEIVAGLAREGDTVITLGAGSIGTAAGRILEEIGRRTRS
jgi:UDP-N-acetylmuramate--alanine ligase